MPNIFFTNGRDIKSIDPWHSEGAMWKYDYGATPMDVDELYSSVAAVYRAINFTADTLSNMPFAIMNLAGDDVDTSDEYYNKVGFLPYPRALFKLMVQSLLVTNRAYIFQETKGTQTKNLRYIAPSTVTANTDRVTGALVSFDRTLGTTKTNYPIDKNGFCNIAYVFNLNWKNELLPDDNSPFKAMMNAAGIGLYADKYIRDFFERGGIKPSILTFDGVMDKTSMEQVESVWTKVIRGSYKFLGKVFNGKFTPVVIGEGIAELKDQTVYDNALRNIAIAVGMPQDALLQNADSYATAQVHKSTWFNDTLVPLAQLIAEPVNEQVFKRMGYRFEFRPDGAEPSMEEESNRIAAANTLYTMLSAGGYKDAAQVAIEAMGIDMPAWFEWEVEEPDEPDVEETTDTETEPVTSEADVEDNTEKSIKSPTIAALREMANWQELAFRKLKRNQPMAFEWKAIDIDPAQAAVIKARLDVAICEEDIKAAFEVVPEPDEIKTLADAMNRMADALCQPVS
jgi:hypothetical protein